MEQTPRYSTIVEKRPFGRTGHESTRAIFGAAALARVDQATADRALEALLVYGVNHIDVAASYGDAELRVGAWMDQHRDAFFLATKTGERTYPRARDEIQRSLERLRVDRVDLIQLHNLTDPDEWQIAMAPGGALDAAIEAREQGLARFIGVTGHGVMAPLMHRRSLERFDFDSVLLPYSWVMMQDRTYAAAFDELWELCEARNVAVQTIKGISLGPWGEKEHTSATWYEPLANPADIGPAVRWVLARPGVFLLTAGDVDLLPSVLDAASQPGGTPSDAEMEALAARLGMTPLFV